MNHDKPFNDHIMIMEKQLDNGDIVIEREVPGEFFPETEPDGNPVLAKFETIEPKSGKSYYINFATKRNPEVKLPIEIKVLVWTIRVEQIVRLDENTLQIIVRIV